MKWEELQSESLSVKEKKDCALKAVAVVSGLDYRDVRARFIRHGRDPGKPTPQTITYAVLLELGITVVDVTQRFKSRTLRTLRREMVGREGCYLVFTYKHVLAVKDGQLCDWATDTLKRIKRIERCVYGSRTS